MGVHGGSGGPTVCICNGQIGASYERVIWVVESLYIVAPGASGTMCHDEEGLEDRGLWKHIHI